MGKLQNELLKTVYYEIIRPGRTNQMNTRTRARLAFYQTPGGHAPKC